MNKEVDSPWPVKGCSLQVLALNSSILLRVPKLQYPPFPLGMGQMKGWGQGGSGIFVSSLEALLFLLSG